MNQKQKKKRQFKKQRLPKGFLAFACIPTVFLLVVFMIIPTIRAIVLSFKEVNVLTLKGSFVGLENYEYMFGDKKFIQALINTLKLMIAVPAITLIISFILAFCLQQIRIREKNLYITVYFFPYYLSASAVAVIWSYILHPTSGMLNKFFEIMGLSSLKHAWVGEEATALWCIAAVLIWACIGYYVVLYMSGLDSIPDELYEAAVLDGASFWQKLIHITLPLMKNIIGTTFILLMSGVIGASFVYSKLLTGGGPNGSSTVLMHYIYSQGIQNGTVGYASAITVITMALGIALAFLARLLTSKSEKE